MLTPAQIRALRSSAPTAKRPNRLWLAMQLAGLTQVQLQAQLGVSQSHISRLQHGQVVGLPLPLARRLATFFGCTVDDLFPDAAAEPEARVS